MIYKIENKQVTQEEFWIALNTGNYKTMADENEQNLVFSQELFERPLKQKRSLYFDAYRKYQAAVNYGEFTHAPAVDEFIKRLRDKDWTVLENVAPQIRYFAGEMGFAESGLVTKE